MFRNKNSESLKLLVLFLVLFVVLLVILLASLVLTYGPEEPGLSGVYKFLDIEILSERSLKVPSRSKIDQQIDQQIDHKKIKKSINKSIRKQSKPIKKR